MPALFALVESGDGGQGRGYLRDTKVVDDVVSIAGFPGSTNRFQE